MTPTQVLWCYWNIVNDHEQISKMYGEKDGHYEVESPLTDDDFLAMIEEEKQRLRDARLAKQNA